MNIVTNALKSDHYFRSTVILFIDIIVSVLATMCMLAFIRFLGVGAAEDRDDDIDEQYDRRSEVMV